MRFKIGLYLIHNNDAKRSKLRDLIFKFGKALHVIVNECYEQPKYIAPSPIKRRLKNIINEASRVYYSIFAYEIKDKRKSVLALAARRIIRGVINCTFEARGDSMLRHKRLTIESYVTNKHITAWKRSLMSRDKYLICFEDDSVILSNSSEMFLEALKLIDEKYQQCQLIYADLAGGFPLDVVLDSKDQTKERYMQLEYHLSRKLKTNTACCYLMSIELVSSFLNILRKDQHLSSLPIDHLINYLGMSSSEFPICIHCVPTVFNHGSFTGQVSSWQEST